MVSFEYLFDVVAQVHWPIYIVMYIFFAGMSAGSFVLSTLGNVFGIRQFKPLSRIGVVISLVLVILGMLFLIIDLEQPAKAYTTLYRANPESVMTWGVYLLTLYSINCAVYAWLIFRSDFVRLVKKNPRSIVKRGFYSALTLEQKDLSEESMLRDAKYARILGMLGVPLALMVCSYTGFILAVVEGNVLGHTVMMPLLFVASAFVSGIALFIIVYAVHSRYFSRERKTDRPTLRNLSVLMAWAMVVDLALFACEIIVLANSGTATADAVWLLTQGPLAGMFLGVEVLLGGMIPIAIILFPATGKRLWGQLTAAGLILVGILAMRFNIIVGGQFIPLAGGELGNYAITLEEILKVLIVISIGVALVYVAFRLLPLQPLAAKAEKRAWALAITASSPATPAPVPDGMDRRAFVRAAMGLGGLLVAAQIGLVGLQGSKSPLGSALAASDTAGGERASYAMIIDLNKCMGCHSCTQACKETYDLPAGVWRSWVTKIKKTSGQTEKHLFLPRLCNHCEHAPCVKVCPVGATYQDENGIVLQRYDRCIGCKYCMMACPYGMRFVHPRLKAVDKCTFCDQRVKKGLDPACVAACPAGARTFGDLKDNTSEVSRLVTTKATTVLKPELGTGPRVYYIGGDTALLESGIHQRQ